MKTTKEELGQIAKFLSDPIEMIDSEEHGVSIIITRFNCGTVGLQSTVTGKKFTRLSQEINKKKTF